MAINIVPQYPLKAWRAFWRSTGADDVTWAADTSGDAVKAYQVVGLGTTIILDRQGRLVYRDASATSYQRLKAEVEKVL